LRERDWDLTVSQRPLYGWLNRQNLAQSKFLRALGREAVVTAEDDVDDVFGVSETLHPRLVSLFVLLLLPLPSWSGRGTLRDL
jgi:hypothetical protein